MLRPEDIEQIHSIGASLALVEHWNQKSDIFQQYDIDVLSIGNPMNAKNILNL